MRTWPVVLVVVGFVACSKKKEEAKKTEPPAPKVEPEPKKDEPPKPKDTEAPKPKDTEAPKAAEPEPTVDCAALVTADDLAKLCGGAKVDVAVVDSKIKVKQEVCRLNVSDPGKKFPKAMVQVFLYENPAAAEGLVKLEKLPETKEVSGVGDRAWTTLHENKIAKIMTTMTVAGAQKGRFVVKVQSDKSGSEKVPCTVDQMMEVTKAVVAKLP
jgi:hypothetical protein